MMMKQITWMIKYPIISQIRFEGRIVFFTIPVYTISIKNGVEKLSMTHIQDKMMEIKSFFIVRLII